MGSTVALLGLFREPDQRRVDEFIGAFVAVVVITLLRRLPDKAERTAAEGGDLPQ